MIFNKTFRFESQSNINDLKEKLVESLINVNNQSFFISPKDNMLRIIPDASKRKELTTLPVTHIKFKKRNDSNKTKVTLFSKPRKIDAGGPYLLVVFCVFLLIAAIVIYAVESNRENIIPALGLVGLSLLIMLIFWYRMSRGYYRYVRGIREEVMKITS